MQEFDQLPAKLENILLLYTLNSKEIPGTLSIQAYPGGYHSMLIFIKRALPDELMMYDLTHSSPDLSGLAIDELDTITIQVEDNGYIYAGGIWQADWSNRQGQYVLNCICACSLDLVNVTRLLSPEEMELVEEAIAYAQAFLKERFLSTILLNCREMGEQAPEEALQLSAESGDPRSANHRWQMLWKVEYL